MDGIVRSPSGDPVAGAEVIFATPDHPAWVNLTPAERKQYEDRPATTVTTDANGHFVLGEMPKDVGLIVVRHDKEGYAEIDPASLLKSADVKLEPWCRIEGTFKVGSKPAPAGTEVRLGDFGWSTQAARPFYGYSTKSDANGHYVLDHVPAGVVQIDIKASKAGAWLNRYAWAEPGKPTRFDIGGTGRLVVGKVSLSGALDSKNLSNGKAGEDELVSASYMRADAPWVSEPRTDGKLSGQALENHMRAWRRTPEAWKLYEHEYRCEVRFLQGDGSFRFDDVPPGKYQFQLLLYRMDKHNTEVAKKNANFAVPDSPAVPTDEPLDLGEIAVGNEGL